MISRPEIEGKTAPLQPVLPAERRQFLLSLASPGRVMRLDLGGNIQYLQTQWQGRTGMLLLM